MPDAELNRVRARWHKGEPAICGWMTTSCPLVAETLAAATFDAVVVDMQHSATSLADVVSLAAAIELRGAEPFVRVPDLSPALIGKLIDLGVTGIIVPMIESRQMAETLASAVRYPPLGTRSFGPRRPKWRFGADYFSKSANTIVALAMIETRRGFDQVAEIAAVDGIDGVFIGPADLAIGLGKPPSGSHGEVEHAIAAIRGCTFPLNRRAGIFTSGAGIAGKRIAQGFDLVTATSDLAAVADAAAADISVLRRSCRERPASH